MSVCIDVSIRLLHFVVVVPRHEFQGLATSDDVRMITDADGECSQPSASTNTTLSPATDDVPTSPRPKRRILTRTATTPSPSKPHSAMAIQDATPAGVIDGFAEAPPGTKFWYDHAANSPMMIIPGKGGEVAPDIVDDGGFICGVWMVGTEAAPAYVKWTSEVSLLNYTEMLPPPAPAPKSAKKPMNVAVKRVPMKKPSASSDDDAMMPSDVLEIVQSTIDLENSHEFRGKARYRNAIASRVYVRIKSRLKQQSLSNEYLPAAVKAVMGKIDHIDC